MMGKAIGWQISTVRCFPCMKRIWVSMHDIYFIDIMDDSKADLVVAVCVTLRRIMQDREQAGNSAGINNNNSN